MISSTRSRYQYLAVLVHDDWKDVDCLMANTILILYWFSFVKGSSTSHTHHMICMKARSGTSRHGTSSRNDQHFSWDISTQFSTPFLPAVQHRTHWVWRHSAWILSNQTSIITFLPTCYCQVSYLDKTKLKDRSSSNNRELTKVRVTSIPSLSNICEMLFQFHFLTTNECHADTLIVGSKLGGCWIVHDKYSLATWS